MRSEFQSFHRNPSALASLAAFLFVVIGVGLFIGIQSPPGTWYQNLQKPDFNPPNWIFPPVWTVLYIFIAVAGWRTFVSAPRSAAMCFWCAQMALNWLWSPVFFTFHQIWAGCAIIVVLFVTILSFIRVRWQSDRLSALLFIPYAAWVGFATLLNSAIGVLN